VEDGAWEEGKMASRSTALKVRWVGAVSLEPEEGRWHPMKKGAIIQTLFRPPGQKEGCFPGLFRFISGFSSNLYRKDFGAI
jgi:hypothetical protein